MVKRKLSKVIIFTVILTICLMLVACSDSDDINKSYTITLYDGETKLSEITYVSGALEFDDPAKDGFTFDGWYYDKEFQNIFSKEEYANLSEKRDIKIYAKFNENKHIHEASWILEKSPSLDEEGLLIYRCALCDQVVKETVLPKLNAEDYSVVEVESTCTKAGDCTYTYMHEGSEYTFKVDLELASHNYVIKADLDKHYKVCKNCGNKTEVSPHNFDKNHICTVCHSFDERYGTSGLLIEKIGEGKAQVSKYTGDDKDVIIPNIYENLAVVGIKEFAFKDNSNVESIRLPKNLKNIGRGAFVNMQNIKHITIDNENTNFYTQNNSIIRTSDNALVVGYIDKVIPASASHIGDYAFADVKDLMSIELTNNIKAIGVGAFENCTNLLNVKNIVAVESVGHCAFKNCSRLSHLLFSTTLNYVGEDAFFNTGDIIVQFSTKDIPSTFSKGWDNDVIANIKYILNTGESNKVFSNNLYADENGLRYKLGESGIIIDKQAIGLSGDVVIPNSLTTEKGSFDVDVICENAFALCTEVTSIKMPDLLSHIEINAFNINDGEKLNGIYISDISAWCKIKFDNLYSNPLMKGENLYLGDQLLTNLTMPYDLSIVEENAFAGCKSLVSVVMSSMLRKILPNTFYACTSLKDVNFQKVQQIGIGAFNGCVSLCKANLSREVQAIEDSAFLGCTNLKEVSTSRKLKRIGSYAFDSCAITKIVIGERVSSIGANAFWGNKGLTIYVESSCESATWNVDWKKISDSEEATVILNYRAQRS